METNDSMVQASDLPSSKSMWLFWISWLIFLLGLLVSLIVIILIAAAAADPVPISPT